MQLRRLLFSQTVSIVVWSICVQNCWSWRRCCAKLDSTVMMRSMRYTMGPAWSTLWASNLYSPTMPLTVNDNPDGEVGVRLSACSAGNVMGTGDTPDFAEDSAIGYILGVAWWGPCSTVREGCEGGGEGRGPGGVCRTGACPGNGENAGVARGTNGAAAHGEDSDTIGLWRKIRNGSTQRRSIGSFASCMEFHIAKKSAEHERRNELFKNCQYI